MVVFPIVNSVFKEYDPLVKDLILKTPRNKIHSAKIIDIKPFKNWSNSRVCLLGDAAHAMTPNLGQGACQAIEDAFVLANCLDTYNSEKAFVEFEKLRIKKVHQIIKGSYYIGKIAHWSHPILIFLRNSLLRAIPQSLNIKQLKSLFTINEI